MASRLERLRATWIIARDVVLSGVAIWGIIHEETSGNVHWELLVVYTALLGVPTALNVWAIRSAGSSDGASSRPRSAEDASPWA